MGISYWLDVFTVDTWAEFREHGADVSGFPLRRWNTVTRMRPGDYLLCYLKGEKRWVGVLEIAGEAYQDETPIWAADAYPARVPVRAVVALDPEYGVPITDLQDELSIFTAPGGWGVQLQGAPKVWSTPDGEAVVRAVQAAAADPVSRPLRDRRARPPAAAQPVVDLAVPDRDGEGVGEQVTIPDEGALEGASGAEVRKHTEIQFRLAQMGSDMGFDVHVARNDKNITWKGRRLADIDGLVESIRLPFDQKTNETIDLIDVLWLESGQIVAAFEIESTTSIYSGLLRMSDLLAMNPNLQIALYLVAPEDRREKVKEQINRPTFATLRRPLVKVCRYIAFETLARELEEHQRVIRHMRIDWLEDDISESCARKDHP